MLNRALLHGHPAIKQSSMSSEWSFSCNSTHLSIILLAVGVYLEGSAIREQATGVHLQH